MAGKNIGFSYIDGKNVKICVARAGDTAYKNGKRSHIVIGELLYAVGDIKKSVIINIKDILKIPTTVEGENTNNNDHGWLDRNGWNKRSIYILYEEKIYRADLRIAKAQDGRYILYAVNVNIEEGVIANKDGTANSVTIGTSTPSNMDNIKNKDISQEKFSKIQTQQKVDRTLDRRNEYLSYRNERLREEIARLKADLKLDRKETQKTYITRKSAADIAKSLMGEYGVENKRGLAYKITDAIFTA